MTANAGPTRLRVVLDHLGGPSAVTWPVFWFSFGFIWFAYVLGNADLVWSHPLARSAALIISQLLAFGVLLLARGTVLQGAASRPRPWLTLASFAVASIVMSTSVWWLNDKWDTAPDADLMAKIPGSALAMLVSLVLSALAADSLNRHRARRDLLLDQRERVVHTRSVVAQAIIDWQQDTVSTFIADLEAEITRLPMVSPREAVETLRWAAQQIVRPRSHELATQTHRFTASPTRPRQRRLDWGQAVRDATNGHPIPPVALAVTLVFLSQIFAVNQFGVRGGLPVLISDGATAWIGAHVANHLLATTLPRLGAGARAIALTVALLAVGSFVAGAAWLLTRDTANAGSAWNAIWAVTLIGWALALGRAAKNQAARTETTLTSIADELDWEVARANQTQWQQQRALARAIHGPVQAAVNAAAIRLDGAIRDGTCTAGLVEEERCNITAVLDSLVLNVAESTPDIELAFRNVQGTWAGLCNIEISVAPALIDHIAADPASSGAIADIVTESCANAVWHGHATEITVRITEPKPLRLLAVIEDDGDPIDPTAKPGLGTKLLDEVALSWQREALTHGTRLSVLLPWSA